MKLLTKMIKNAGAGWQLFSKMLAGKELSALGKLYLCFSHSCSHEFKSET